MTHRVYRFLLVFLMPSFMSAQQPIDPLDVMPADQWLPRTIALAPLVYALTCGAQYLEQETVSFVPMNPIQDRFVARYLPAGCTPKEIKKQMAFHKFRQKELQVWVSKNVVDINAQLEKHGYDIRLRKAPEPAFYLASIMDIAIEWLKKGFATKLRSGNHFYPAVSMDTYITAYKAPSHSHPVFGVQTKGSDVVYMTKAEEKCSNFALLSAVMKIEEQLQAQGDGFDELIFPMIDLDEKNDISWLLELGFDSKWFVSQALQQNKFAMNEKGARAQSAAAISVSREAAIEAKPKIYVMDEPFLCWISRPGVPYPVFAGYLDQEVWRRPASVTDEVSADATKGVPLSIGVL